MSDQGTTASGAPDFVDAWFGRLRSARLSTAVVPSTTALISTDMLLGFCRTGALASERVGALAEPVARLFERAHKAGVRRIVLTQDVHEPDSVEFAAWPAHCLRGTREAATIPELTTLPFVSSMIVFEKNSLSPGFGTGFDAWLDANADLTHAIVVGNCTDLCVYQLAMHLRLRANAFNRAPFEVIVPANHVDTYDLPVKKAKAARAPAHPGDFFHRVFLYHLALNGVRVVSRLT